eukprot:360172_1
MNKNNVITNKLNTKFKHFARDDKKVTKKLKSLTTAIHQEVKHPPKQIVKVKYKKVPVKPKPKAVPLPKAPKAPRPMAAPRPRGAPVYRRRPKAPTYRRRRPK